MINIGTLFIPELFYTIENQVAGSFFGYNIIYGTYTIILLFYMLGYLVTKKNIKFKKLSYDINYDLTIIFILLSYLIYFPIIIEFSEFILTPRVIYEKTRVGYGLSYFTSTVFNYIALVLFLYEKKPIYKKIIYLFLILLMAYLHGSKGQFITILMIFISFNYVANENTINFWKFIVFSFASLLIAIFVFYLTTNSIELGNILNFIIYYADYSRNAIMLIDGNNMNYLGQILFEDNLYSRIPRSLLFDKPKDYGSFMLAKQYFPDQFYLEQGIPSFGIGIYFADFSFFAIPILGIISLINGIFTKILKNSIEFANNPFQFVIMLYFIGVSLIPVGFGMLLPEHILIATIMFIGYKFKKLFYFKRMFKTL